MSEAALTRDEILNADDRRCTPINMREFGWPGTVYIRILAGSELERIAELHKEGIESKPDYTAYMVSLFLCDENGVRLFDDANYRALNHKAGMALQHIAAAGIKLNKIEGEDIDGAEKNSVATDGGVSSIA